jgi:hypothetical protein
MSHVLLDLEAIFCGIWPVCGGQHTAFIGIEPSINGSTRANTANKSLQLSVKFSANCILLLFYYLQFYRLISFEMKTSMGIVIPAGTTCAGGINVYKCIAAQLGCTWIE